MVDRLLRKDPAERFPSAEALGEELSAARGAIVRIPAPVAAFIRDGRAGASEISTVVIIAAFAFVVQQTMWGRDSIAGIFFEPFIAIMLGLAAVLSGHMLLRTRDLLRLGYQHQGVRPALLLEDRKSDEEDAAAATRRLGLRPSTWVTLGVGSAATALCVAMTTTDVTPLVWLGAAGGVTAPLVTFRKLWRALRRGRSLWTRLMSGSFGRLVFSISGIGLRKKTAVPAGGEPTALVIGQAVDELFSALPLEQRKRLAGVPEVIARLEADALALRGEGQGPARDARFAAAVQALEALRLDLLKLHAGTATLDELTRDLDAARRIGDQVDAALELDERVQRSDQPSPLPPV
jgi:serine/threonine-protein kinase